MEKDIGHTVETDYPLTTNAMIIEENRRIMANSPPVAVRYNCHGKKQLLPKYGKIVYCGSTSFNRAKCPHYGIEVQYQLSESQVGAKKHTCNYRGIHQV